MKSEMERVVVTGMGVASPLGITIPDYWDVLLAGQSGVEELDDDEFGGLRTKIGARVTGYTELDHFSRKEARRMSRSSKLGVLAAVQAVNAANIANGDVDQTEVGVLVSSSIGGFSASDHFYRDYYLKGTASPFIIPISMNHGPSTHISIRYGFQGPLLNLDAACASAAHSIGYVFSLIRSGVLKIGLAGAADSPFSRGVMEAWCALRALSERNNEPATACRPFSADRDGMVLGEAAGVFILEAESSACQRGVPILAEVVGYGASSDSSHLTQPTQEGPVFAMQRALTSANITAEKIDYINAHATGTKWGDSNETTAIKQVYGEFAYDTPVVANKAAFGHSIAASGALELAGCILSLRDQILPPTINYTTPDPECDLDYVTEGSRAHSMEYVMSNSFAFGGSNASLIIRKYRPVLN